MINLTCNEFFLDVSLCNKIVLLMLLHRNCVTCLFLDDDVDHRSQEVVFGVTLFWRVRAAFVRLVVLSVAEG